MLIPFYIFSHENRFPEYNSNEQRLEELKAEYQVILERLDGLEQQGFIGAFDKRTIIELSDDVIREIAQKSENVRKGVGEMMSGAMIETEVCRLLPYWLKALRTKYMHDNIIVRRIVLSALMKKVM